MENLVDPYRGVPFYIDIVIAQKFLSRLSPQLCTDCSECKNNNGDNVTKIKLIREVCNAVKSFAEFQ